MRLIVGAFPIQSQCHVMRNAEWMLVSFASDVTGVSQDRSYFWTVGPLATAIATIPLTQ